MLSSLFLLYSDTYHKNEVNNLFDEFFAPDAPNYHRQHVYRTENQSITMSSIFAIILKHGSGRVHVSEIIAWMLVTVY
jgi:hypothetical protein